MRALLNHGLNWSIAVCAVIAGTSVVVFFLVGLYLIVFGALFGLEVSSLHGDGPEWPPTLLMGSVFAFVGSEIAGMTFLAVRIGNWWLHDRRRRQEGCIEHEGTHEEPRRDRRADSRLAGR